MKFKSVVLNLVTNIQAYYTIYYFDSQLSYHYNREKLVEEIWQRDKTASVLFAHGALRRANIDFGRKAVEGMHMDDSRMPSPLQMCCTCDTSLLVIAIEAAIILNAGRR